MQNKQQIKLGIALLTTLTLIACNGGSNVSSTNRNIVPQTSPLQKYINSLSYTSVNSKHLMDISGVNQQSFTTPGDLTINSIDIKFYLDNGCSAIISNVTLSGAVTPTAGTYTSTNPSNNVLCTLYANGGSSGCAGLYADLSSGELQSMQFVYNVDNGIGSSFPVNAPCMANPAAQLGTSPLGIEGIANWTDPTNAVACNGSGSCGFSQAYNASIVPPPVIFVTESSYTGNLGGLAGANAKCNSDTNKPSFGGTYKALLVNNDATTNELTYYRPNGTYLSVANSGMFVDFAIEPDHDALVNSISSSALGVWTGFGGSQPNETCLNWTSSSNTDIGYIGTSDQVEAPYLNSNTPDCSNPYHLYCVKQ